MAQPAAYLGDTKDVVLAAYAHFMPDDDRAREIMNALAGQGTVLSVQGGMGRGAGQDHETSCDLRFHISLPLKRYPLDPILM